MNIHMKNRAIVVKEHKPLSRTLRDYEKLEEKSILDLFRNILLCRSTENVNAAVTLAKSINMDGINESNYLLYFLLLRTNNEYVIESLIGKRNPFLLFASFKPNWYMLEETFRFLSRFKRDELNEKCLLALLGVIQNTYKISRYGYSVYHFTISDIYNIGKYLYKKKEQESPINRLILDILFDIYRLGELYEDAEEKRVALVANSIRMAFFDIRKDMSDVIPDVLLIKSDLKNRSLKPSILYTGRK